METLAHHQTSDEPSAPAAAAYPRWILLENIEGIGDPDAKTVAHASTSKGRPISVSFLLAAPPAFSRLRLHSPGLPDGVYIRSLAIAAHRDSFLVNIKTTSQSQDRNVFVSDYFIYCTGDAAAEPSRPPSLSLLPPCYLTQQEEWKPKKTRYMHTDGIALLRRGRDEVLVAALDSRVEERQESGPMETELCLLRSSDWEWELMRLPVIHDEGKRKELSRWRTDGAVPVGDRFLFWVDYSRGIIYSDVWNRTPELSYVSLPVEPIRWRSNNGAESFHRSVCATDGGNTVRFMEVLSRCCCGCPVDTTCAVSRQAFTITTWALSMDDMTTWEKVGVIDCDELWSLPGYHGIIPRIKPEHLMVSLDDPDVLCFIVHKNMYDKGVDGDLGARLIKVDTRRMELLSIDYYREFYHWPQFVSCVVSRYFDASTISHTPARRKEPDLDAPPRPSNLTLPGVASPENMLATLRDIPNLAPDDMLKVYDILTSDKSRFRFKSLLALPMDMRKDYCLLIQKLWCFHV